MDLLTYDYPILIEKEALTQLPFLIEKQWDNVEKIACCIDEHVYDKYQHMLCDLLTSLPYQCDIIIIPSGEQSKSMDEVMAVYRRLSQKQYTRSDALIAIGGGVVGDMAGFVAATYMRGIHYAIIPTTFLSQVDSSIGGKNAINVAEAKNNIGTFYFPDFVISDPMFLNTLPVDIYNSGFVEMLKVAMICDADLWHLIDRNQGSSVEWIRQAIENKLRLVQNDQFDYGQRMLLNFGHTLGHAIETVTHYQTYAHGVAVGIGMVEILKLATHAGWCDASEMISLLEHALKQRQLPTAFKSEWSNEALMSAIIHDKKARGSHITLVLVEQLGHGFTYEVSLEDFYKALQSYRGE